MQVTFTRPVVGQVRGRCGTCGRRGIAINADYELRHHKSAGRICLGSYTLPFEPYDLEGPLSETVPPDAQEGR